MAVVLGGVFLWSGGFGSPREPWQPKTTFADMVETKEAVVYRARPEDPPGAQAQRREEERKEAASWEMLRRLTIEVERPPDQPRPSFPSRFEFRSGP
ncbi:hypothetical protein [Desulfosoma sp.]